MESDVLATCWFSLFRFGVLLSLFCVLIDYASLILAGLVRFGLGFNFLIMLLIFDR